MSRNGAVARWSGKQAIRPVMTGERGRSGRCSSATLREIVASAANERAKGAANESKSGSDEVEVGGKPVIPGQGQAESSNLVHSLSLKTDTEIRRQLIQSIKLRPIQRVTWLARPAGYPSGGRITRPLAKGLMTVGMNTHGQTPKLSRWARQKARPPFKYKVSAVRRPCRSPM